MDNDHSWDDQKYFLAVIETGSFAKAARMLGVSHPTVRSKIDALETSIGTSLFVRSGSGLVPTLSARNLLEPAKAMADAAHRFARQAASCDVAISGRIRISVPDIVGSEVIPRMLLSLRQRYPELSVELVLSNTLTNLIANDADLAIRTATPTQESLVVRKIAAIPLGLFASRDYVTRRGTPVTVDDLKQHDLIGPDRNRDDWGAAKALDLQETLPNFTIRTDSNAAQLAAARVGLGIVACQVPLGLSDPCLVRVLPDVNFLTLNTWIVAQENVIKIPRVRAVFDHLVEAYKIYISLCILNS